MYTSTDKFTPDEGLAPRRSNIGLIVGACMHILPALEEAVRKGMRSKKDQSLRVNRIEETGGSKKTFVGIRFPVDEDARALLDHSLETLKAARAGQNRAFWDEEFKAVDGKSLSWATKKRKTLVNYFAAGGGKKITISSSSSGNGGNEKKIKERRGDNIFGGGSGGNSNNNCSSNSNIFASSSLKKKKAEKSVEKTKKAKKQKISPPPPPTVGGSSKTSFFASHKYQKNIGTKSEEELIGEAIRESLKSTSSTGEEESDNNNE